MRLLLMIVCLLLTTLLYPSFGHAEVGVSANNAVLIEGSSGRILFKKEAHEKKPIASITKIMTALVAIESGKMNETVKITKRAAYTEGSSIYLKPGEKILLKDLVYGLMLRSGNDAAVAISEHVGGSMEGFVHLMNKQAQWLGMTNTSFDNPHGLDAETHYSTAYDMALLMRYAMENEQFREITGTEIYKSDSRDYSWKNKHRLVTGMYKYSTGGKTGYTRVAGRTLVSVAEKNKMRLIAVTLNGSDDWRDHISMFEWGFDSFDMTTIDQSGEEIFHIKKTGEKIMGYLHEEIKLPLKEQEQKLIASRSFLLENASEKSEGVIGKTIYFVDSVPVRETPIYANDKHEKGFLAKIVTVYRYITGLD
ncbi:D-alanyl-D-alanine carboxypeptidase family protein [Virgibacillus kekensis]|uniref:D-alanyl-D-alanine carboxypeptidase family protein n=1 Tax=Virgibacillus kekensis TaxID=202261 RepID=A0ABV9DF70_9BACI